MGRRRTETVAARVTGRQRRIIEAAADEAGVSVSEFLGRAGERAARAALFTDDRRRDRPRTRATEGGRDA